jgi:hypothetical protein
MNRRVDDDLKRAAIASSQKSSRRPSSSDANVMTTRSVRAARDAHRTLLSRAQHGVPPRRRERDHRPAARRTVRAAAAAVAARSIDRSFASLARSEDCLPCDPVRVVNADP